QAGDPRPAARALRASARSTARRLASRSGASPASTMALRRAEHPGRPLSPAASRRWAGALRLGYAVHPRADAWQSQSVVRRRRFDVRLGGGHPAADPEIAELNVILSLRRIRDPSARGDEVRILRLRSQARFAQD